MPNSAYLKACLLYGTALIAHHSGLVGLCSEEVLELMAEDYPQKYQEYIAVVQEREFQATLRKKTMESKRMALLVRLTCMLIKC